MNSNRKSKWWVDAALFTGFILAFFMDLTGLALHQWLGLALGALVVIHTILHWNWIKAVTARFFSGTSHTSRLYYLIDASLWIGFLTMIGTGLVISTWLDLPLAAYSTWRSIHVTSSMVTLLVTVVKIGLHWRWIVSTLRGLVFQPSVPQTQMSTTMLMNSRREFLKVMGVTGAAAVVAVGKSMLSLQGSQAADEVSSEQTTLVDTQAETVSTVQTETGSTAVSTAQPTAEVSTSTPTATATETPLPTATATVAVVTEAQNESSGSLVSACTTRCRRGCSYPGHCRKYTDSNGNNRCDYGECL